LILRIVFIYSLYPQFSQFTYFYYCTFWRYPDQMVQ